MHKKIEKFLHIPKILREKYTIDESFNLFKVLRGTNDEVRLHSRFIAELLDPVGSHGLRGEFLNFFVSDVLKIDDFDVKTATVQKEWKDIDIFIRNQCGQAIIIENKIYAGDQENQLNKYFNIARDLNVEEKNIHVLYLSLDGKEASQQSLDGIPTYILENNYKKISYKSDISQWLTICRKEAVELPELRESITQYLNLVAELTHTNQSALFMNELENWFASELLNGQPVNLLDAMTVAKDNYHARQIDIFRKLLISRLNGIAINAKDSVTSFSECLKFVTKGSYFEIWLYPVSGVHKLQVGFRCQHGTSYISVWCSKKGDPVLFNAVRNTISTSSMSTYSGSNQYDAVWKYISDPIKLSESTDENLRKLSDINYVTNLAENIAIEMKGLVDVIQTDSTLEPFF